MADVVYLLGHLSPRSGGVWPMARGFAAHSDHRVRLLGLRDAGAGSGLRLPVGSMALATLGPDRFGYAPSMPAALDWHAPDLLHNYQLWMYSSWLSSRWGRRSGRPYVISPNGMLDAWALARSRWRKSLALRLYEARHLAGAACFHALTAAELRSVRELGLRNPVAVIPSGVEPVIGYAQAPPWSASVPSGAPVLLYLGRLHPKKGLDRLLRAWRSVATDPWQLVIAGWGPARYVRRLRQVLRHTPDAHLFGPWYGPDKAAALAASRALVLPSLSEGLPQTVLEAWAHGVPVLMTSACHLPEGFRHGAALPMDIDAMSLGLHRLLQMSEEELDAMGKAGRDLATSRFRWADATNAMDRLYDWCLGGGSPPEFVSTD